MIAILALFLATAFPSNSKTSWMRPESFDLTIGMNRAAAVEALESNGWKTKKGDAAGQLVVDYADDKSLTLQFAGERLTSIRFELFTILQEAPKAFEEERMFLRQSLGKPRQGTKKILIYDHKLPNVMAVLSADPKSAQAQKGVGMLVVRYYDPAVK
jgi:predicted amidohydrolase YtcJ